ncbi:MAG: hypothetical protein IH627_08045 [Rubrivivax sp.]|nr:hypothetical protein [Rubrivivax sp.]
MTKPLRAVNADATCCHRIGKSYRPKLTGTPAAVPTDAVEADAKRFEADPASLTLYVLRRRWGDASMVAPVTLDGAAGVVTIPESLARVRLKPGAHRLSAQWEGRTVDISVQGRAGELRVVELVGSGWAWGTSFSWEAFQADEVKSRAQASKLVADLDLRR